jgi:amino acid adenylation domain-containing protein/thioester reductase-like protein
MIEQRAGAGEWATLADAICDPRARVLGIGVIAPDFRDALDRVPWLGSSFGFERELGRDDVPHVDLAVHADADAIRAPEADERWARLWAHPVWRAALSLPARLRDATAVGLEFDVGRLDGALPLPVVFLVRDDLIVSPRDRWRAWADAIRGTWLPAVRGEERLAPALDEGIQRALDALPAGARAVHFGSLAVRGLDAARLCVGGASVSEVAALVGALGFPAATLADAAAQLAARVAPLGDLRFLNIDVMGAMVLPRLGFEVHFPGAPTRAGLAPLAREALDTLVERGLVRPGEVDALDAWCGLEDGVARGLTHLKLQLEASGATRVKAYLKVSPRPRAAHAHAHAAGMPAVERPAPPLAEPAFAPGRLHDGFLAQAARRPHAIALRHGAETWTYAEVARASAKVAASLHAAGVGPGALVGIHLPHAPIHVIAALGVLRAGAAYVPTDPAWPAARIAEVFDRAAVAAVLRAELAPSSEGRLALGVDARPAHEVAPPPDPTHTGDRAYVIFTSGSTGAPKGVVITHRAARNTVDDVCERFAVGPDDRVLALASLAFDLSVWDLFGTLAAGACLVFPDAGAEPLPVRAARSLTRDGITIWNSVPATFGLTIASMEAGATHALRLALLSGDWIPTTLPARAWERLGGGVRLVSLGGSTEGAIWSILHPIERHAEAEPSIPYGLPTSMRGQLLLPLRPDAARCDVGEVGELVILGVGVAEGYFGEPERTAERFPIDARDGRRTFRTGDFGYLRPDGRVQLLGRRDAQVKIQGYRVDLTEISTVLAGLPGVREAVVGVVDAHATPRIGAVIVAEGASSDAIPGWLAALAGRLPRYAVPLPPDVRLVDALPLTANGKVDRGALFGQGTERAPAVSVDGVLDAFRDALGQPTLAKTDNLFEHGGDSLAAAWIATQVEKLGEPGGRRLEVVDVYTHPTAAALATLLATPRDERAGRVARVAPETVDLPGDVDARGLPPAADDAPVFLTGATGTLGPHLVRALRASGREVVCLVRASSEAHARQRLRRALARAGLGTHLDGVRVVVGDVALPGLGLRPDELAALGASVGRIVHAAASVGFMKSAEELARPNVQGTIEILRLAVTARLHPVCLVSTAAVHGLLGQEPREAHEGAVVTPPTAPRGVLEGGYPWSKWSAERVARQAEARGVPLTVVRPAFVLGDTDPSRALLAAGADDLLGAMLRTCRQLGAVPTLPWSIPVVPVDHVAAAIARLAFDPRAASETFHLVPQEGLSLASLAGAWRAEGRGVREVAWPAWRALVEARAARGDREARLLTQATSDELHRLHPPTLETHRATALLGALEASSALALRGVIRERGPEDDVATLRDAVNGWLDGLCWPPDRHGARLTEAMRDALGRGGKRLRPALCAGIALAEGVALDDILPIAGAIELVHTMSLVHDDLPCMDDADLRRGAPSIHRTYGEGLAVLAGDAMLARAFELVAEHASLPPERRVRILSTLARCCGADGLAGGQAFDIGSRGRAFEVDALTRLAAQKTGALFAAACRIGAEAAGAEALAEPLERFGAHVGTLFQILDDLSDRDEAEEAADKPRARDEANQVPNLVRLHGREVAVGIAEGAVRSCHAALADCGDRAFVPMLRHVLGELAARCGIAEPAC